MTVRELRHGRPRGRFSKSRGLSTSVSLLSYPPPPRSFTYAIFRAVFDSCSSLFAPKRTIQTIKKLKKMLFPWRVNLTDQNKQQPQGIKMRVRYHTWPLSMKQLKPLIDTCKYCVTSRTNQALRSLANAGFQNRGVCLQLFPSFPSPSLLFHFVVLVSFLARSKPKIPFHGPF